MSESFLVRPTDTGFVLSSHSDVRPVGLFLLWLVESCLFVWSMSQRSPWGASLCSRSSLCIHAEWKSATCTWLWKTDYHRLTGSVCVRVHASVCVRMTVSGSPRLCEQHSWKVSYLWLQIDIISARCQILLQILTCARAYRLTHPLSRTLCFPLIPYYVVVYLASVKWSIALLQNPIFSSKRHSDYAASTTGRLLIARQTPRLRMYTHTATQMHAAAAAWSLSRQWWQ